MNKHECIDLLTAGIGGLYGESVRFFNRSVESPSLSDLVHGAKVPMIAAMREEEAAVEVEMASGIVRTGYRIVQQTSPRAPILIFHHGSGDYPYHTRIRKIISAAPADSPLREATVIATNSPFNGSRRAYMHAVGDLALFTTILAASAVLIEGIVRSDSHSDLRPVVVSGISLGGWIANLHHAFFNTADEYRPVFAGAAPDALFLDSAYARLTSTRALEYRSRLSTVLNFEDAYAKIPNDNVYALLARYDQYVQLDRQRSAYRESQLTVMDRGHVTGSLAGGEIARFLAEGRITCGGKQYSGL